MNKNILHFLLLPFLVFACSSSNDDDGGGKEPEDPINTFFVDEVKPQTSIKCFDGAYYRKVVSSKDKWLGMGGTVILPQITFDENRKNPNKPGQYLDNPSVYMGGNMGGQETDIGLTWEVVREPNGSVSAERKAFRPFMRRTSHVSGEASNYANAPAEDRYYWYPGDKVTISLQIVNDYKLKFVVEGEGKKFETEYDCAGYKKGNVGEFKRVNAIDQVSNEGKPAQTTGTKVENSKWEETYLFRLYKDEVVKVPVHSGRFTDMRCPDVKYFRIAASDDEKKKGCETINISGNGY
ncbi:hypothetical protein [Bacteroides sp. 51]|uniref:hypothetical protein n=1 Tax=Bacteroides sp. 51 TaxID=2302938 RepID=UPI0013D71758|nr:hypothetical protein [Bacteroides sp. 51]NDV81687.1 hypothetical protein [Bacteroides sp. 51]